MKNWIKIADAFGLQIPKEDLERLAPVADALERSFEPLKANLADDEGYALAFVCRAEAK